MILKEKPNFRTTIDLLCSEFHPNTGYAVTGNPEEFTDLSGLKVTSLDTPGFSWSDLDNRHSALQTQWTNEEYARKRQAEFPSIQDLVVALYDTDDKSAVEAKRASVKAKYPKP